MVKNIENLDEFNKELKKAGNKLVVIDFTATWCGPCRMMAPFFEKLSKEYSNVVFLKVDVDNVPDVTGEYGIRAMPTFIFLKNEEKVGELMGADKDKLEDLLKEHM